MFFVWCQRMPFDEPVGIHEVPAFHSGKKTSCGRLLAFFTTVPVFVQQRTRASFWVQTSSDSFASVVSPVTFLKNALG
jgi:hypothetical protein